MGALEDALRATFAERVAVVPAVDDAAGRAIEGARRTKRLRTTVTGLVALAGVILAGGVLAAVQPGSGWGGRPEPNSVPTLDRRFPMQLLVGNQIRLPDGQQVSLAELPPAERAYRISPGWLVVTHVDGEPKRKLWLVTTAGSMAQLADGEGIAVSPDGQQVAWGGGGRVSVGVVWNRQLVNVHTTTGTGALRPAFFAGRAIVLSGPTWSAWYPDRGDYTAAKSSITGVYGVSLDGATLYGAVNGSNCLSDINPDNMLPRRTVCGVRVAANYEVAESPDARRLVVSGEGILSALDISTMWTDGLALSTWSVRAGSLAWLDNNTIIASGVGSITLLRMGQGPRQDRNEYLTGDDGKLAVRVVPDLVN